MMAQLRKTLTGEFLAEFVGTGVFILLGTSCVAAKVLAGATFGQWEISIIWGLAVAFAVYIAGGVTGAHINPAVTIGLASVKSFPWRKVPLYLVAQFAGAFVGAVITYALYQPLFADWETAHSVARGSVDSLATAGIFTTFANSHLTYIHAMFVELAITTVLMLGIMALGDENNIAPKGALGALLVGLLVAVIGGAVGPLTGFAMNPARDLSPRIFTYLMGWGDVVMTGGRDQLYAWVAVLGPIIGGILGATLYVKLISPYLPGKVPEEIEDDVPVHHHSSV